jgi:hypothetical protein
MGKKLVMVPEDFAIPFSECRPGFFVIEDELFLKSEYGEEAYCSSGEAFWGGASNKEDRAKIKVIPVTAEWLEL